MRLICKVVGNNKCFHLECDTKKGAAYGFDIPSTEFFMESLCHSINRQIDVCGTEFRSLIGTNEQYHTNATRITRQLSREKYGIINVDISVERRKGKQIAVCRISTDDSDCDVRTANILPETARFIYKTIYFLKHMNPPRGMEILRTMEIIRNFNDPKASTHELYIEDGTVKEREKVIKK